MRDIKFNENYEEIIELLENKVEFTCAWNYCANNANGSGGTCIEVFCDKNI